MHNQCTSTIYFMSGSKMTDKRRSQYNNNNNSMSNSNDATTLLKKAEQRYQISFGINSTKLKQFESFWKEWEVKWNRKRDNRSYFYYMYCMSINELMKQNSENQK